MCKKKSSDILILMSSDKGNFTSATKQNKTKQNKTKQNKNTHTKKNPKKIVDGIKQRHLQIHENIS